MKTMRTASGTVMLVPGIFSIPSNENDWTDIGERWVDSQTSFCARKFEYFTGPIIRFFYLDRLARGLADEVAASCVPVRIVAHSNGAEVVSRAVRKYWMRCDKLVLVAPACETDFNRNGFNEALLKGRIGSIKIYASRHDSALGFWARLSRIGRPLGMGFGTLGADGPKRVDLAAESKIETVWADVEHAAFIRSPRLENILSELCK